MKFIKESGPKGLHIPAVALKLSHIPLGERVDMYTMDDALVLLKGRMTAPELLKVVEQLHTMAAELLFHLSKVCGSCEDCEGGCPCGKSEDSPLQHLPPELLIAFAEAGTCLGELEEHLILEDTVYGR